MTYDLQKLKTSLKDHEGLRDKPYDDQTGKEVKSGTTVKGKVSIGIGHNLTDNGLPPFLIDALLGHDIEEVESILDYHEPQWRTYPDPLQRFLVEMVFNIGWRSWESFYNTRRMIRDRQYTEAAHNLKASKWYRDVGEKRYNDMAALLLECVDVS